MTWKAAVAFCEQLSQAPLERSARRLYRLPTEAEWEYACRAGTTTEYSFGADPSKADEYGWFAVKGTQPVGKKKPNPWELFDIYGNVWEWCSDWYAADYYHLSPLNDPAGPPTGDARIMRGGCWWYKCGSSWRGRENPGHYNSNLGFRAVMVISQ